MNVKPIVAIVGRPNVGKSTLFNRIIQRREAIVDDAPGITRDRKLAEAEWESRSFLIMDTGGYIPKTQDVIEQGISQQVRAGIEEADVIVFLVDCTTGITDVDGEVADFLRRTEKPVVLAVNKVDNMDRESLAVEFYRLGIGALFLVSAMAGRGTGDLLSHIVSLLPKSDMALYLDPNAIHLAIVGRPNAGKSTFINKMLGEERLLVTDIPGTTRDAVDVKLDYKAHLFQLVDTAGLRKRTKVRESVEYYSALRTAQVVDACDIACVFIDGGDLIAAQDMRVIRQAIEAKKGVIIVINKWDLAKGDEEKIKAWGDQLEIKLKGMKYIPIARISCKTGFRVTDVLDVAVNVADERKMRISTVELNALIREMNRTYQHPAVQGKRIKITFGQQVGANPPRFTFHTNHPQLIAPAYRRYLENQIRNAFGFHGVPLTFSFKNK